MLADASATAFTAAVARIERGGELVFERAYGATRDDAQARPVFVDTRFDLASITKIFVATLALRAVDDGILTLDGPLLRWFPEWAGTDHEPVTLRMLLAHDAGFNSGADYRQLLGFDVERYAAERPLIGVPGEKVVYSDLGFIALGTLIARARGASLSADFDSAFGGGRAGFRVGAAERADIPATEEDDWRGRVQGFVHDEKAYLMGGVAGHAGVFGAASDVARLTEAYLGPLCGRAGDLLSEELVRASVREHAADPVLRRGLGWALKTSDANSCGRLLARETFGHTGFVGTCVWADPTRDLQGVLLTNTVYYGRRDTRDLRADFYEAMIEDLGA